MITIAWVLVDPPQKLLQARREAAVFTKVLRRSTYGLQGAPPYRHYYVEAGA